MRVNNALHCVLLCKAKYVSAADRFCIVYSGILLEPTFLFWH